MPSPDDNVKALIAKAEAILERGINCDVAEIGDMIAEAKVVMVDSARARKELGPLVGRLRSAQQTLAASPIHWVPVLQGHLAIGHRPKIKTIKGMRQLGGTHVLTLLSQSEGAEDIGDEVRRAGLEWIWLPLVSASPPPAERRAEILRTLDSLRQVLEDNGCVYVHCSAGIHRTGMVTYVFLRSLQFSARDSVEILSKLRPETADGLAEDHIEWAEQFS